jgi:hypothetical protein
MKLAIKGHPTEGNKVIEILEMLGGTNVYHHRGGDGCVGYTIEENKIRTIPYIFGDEDFIILSIEEFLEKFPYKVGDKVTHSDYESPLEIVGMKWKDNSIKYEVYTNDYGYWFSVDELQLVKENQNIMTNLAIRGHKERGKEVIEILKMLGGKDVGYSGTGSQYYYYIDEYDNIAGTTELPESKTFVTYTLEEFLEKYPYKVGDKVKYINNIFCIKSSQWDNDKKTVIYYIDADWSAGYVVEAGDLQPYKEEIVKDNLVTEEDFNNTPEVEQEYMNLAENLLNQLIEGTHWKCNEFDSQKMLAMFLKKNTSAVAKKDNSVIFDIPKGYEFAGVDDNNQQVVFTKIQPEYPKTYKECCEVLGLNTMANDAQGYRADLIICFQELLIARNAYWEIAGEEMGLGKPWEPDFKDDGDKYFICYLKDEIWKSNIRDCNRFLVFPTEKIRDEFYENFKDSIKVCKNLI